MVSPQPDRWPKRADTVLFGASKEE